MAVSPEYKAFVKEQLEPLGPVTVRSMFGGAGVFLEGVMFGLIAGETLYMKVDDSNRPGFEAEGMGPFTYEARGKQTIMSYWELPERLYDDPEELVTWARDAVSVALRSAKRKKKR